MRTERLFVAAAVSLALTSSSWGIIGGYEPAVSDTRFDAVGAIGQTHNMMCFLNEFDCPLADPCGCLNTHGGLTLISPTTCLMARHSGPNAYGCGLTTPDPCLFTARFRRKPDGSLGDPSDCSTYFHVKIKQFLTIDTCGPTDIALAILDQPVTHIQPIPVDLTINVQVGTPVIIGGWGSTTQCTPGTFQMPGKLFLKNMTISSIGCGTFGWSGVGPGMFDSGGAVLVDTPSGLRAAGVITHCGGGWDSHVMLGDTPASPPCCAYNFNGAPGFPCGDYNGDNTVNVDDLLLVISNWGPCADCNNCPFDRYIDCEVGNTELVGVFTSWGQSCNLPCYGDVTYDDDVDVIDLTWVLESWGDCPCYGCPADVNHNGEINFADLEYVLEGWGGCPGFGPPGTLPQAVTNCINACDVDDPSRGESWARCMLACIKTACANEELDCSD